MSPPITEPKHMSGSGSESGVPAQGDGSGSDANDFGESKLGTRE